MVQRSTGECPGSECWRYRSRRWLCSARRCTFSRNRHLILATTVVGVLVVLININFSTTVHDKPAMEVSVEKRLPPYAVDNRISEEESDSRTSGEENDNRTSGEEGNTSTTVHMETRRHVTVFTRILQKQLRKQTGTEGQTGCIHPRLGLRHDANQFAYHDMPPLNCTEQGLFYSQNGVLVLNTSVVESPSLLGECAFYHITRVNDDMYSYASSVIKESPPFETSVPHDFVRITCVLKSTLEENKDLVAVNHNLDPDYDDSYANLDLEPGDFFKRKLLGEIYHKLHPTHFDSYDKLAHEVDNHFHRKFLNEESQNSFLKGNVLLSNDGMAGRNASSSDTSVINQNNLAKGDEMVDEYDKDWATYFMGNEEFVDPEATYIDFDQFIVQVQPKPHVFQRIAQVEAASQGQRSMKLNVLMFAMDSMSHLSYQRKLPQTYRFLKEELGAAILENYNIVGDATTAAIIPMLTGHTEMDLPDARKSLFEGAVVDEYPMVWKRFSQEGYATLFAEDEPSLSTFNLRLNGFRDPPTDHYMRTFWQALWDSTLRQGSNRFCTGNTPNHQFMLTYLEDFFIKYNNVSRFAFGFHVELSHNDNNPAQYIDSDLVGFLRRLRQQKILEDTVLIIFGDHGARYSKVRSTVQGKLEERLPLMSLAFPRKFRQRYPDLHHNLMTNMQRLSTPFDIHETLLDIADLSGIGRRESIPPGISLLREIPAERTCEDAGISMHWCTCLHQVRLDPEEELVQPAAVALMWYLNAQVDSHRQQCARLELAKVLSIFMVLPNEMVLKYQKSSDRDQQKPFFSHRIDLDVAHYQLQVETKPCGALYEATVRADFRNSSDYKYSVTPGISRINKYGSQPSCVQDRFPMLRKFCCCLDYLEKNGTR
ncbi:uncharacterized protein LOC143288706 [Babylonia areolata]|uniref:uncharacterized protein LOC143288706 n=1 Tax=Babylonia areolata TaxID=304850 RepID=UPI003FD0479A